MADNIPVDIDFVFKNLNFQEEKRKLEDGIKGVTSTTQKEADKIQQIYKNMAAGIGVYFSVGFMKSFVSEMASVRGEFQQLEVALETILKSKSEADKLMQQVVEFASTTPFELKDVATGTKQLLAYGFAAKDIISTMRMLGDVSAGVSAPIGDIVYLYGTLRTQGRAYTRDIMQFTSRGIPIIAELAKQFGVAESEVNTLVESGSVGFKEVEKAFQSLTNTGGIFTNLMEKQSQTITGLYSNFQDAIDSALNGLGEANQGIIQDSIKGATLLVENYDRIVDILKVIVATYGAYKAATIAVAVAENYRNTSIITTQVHNTFKMVEVTRQLTAAEWLQVKATSALNAAMSINPFVAATVAIAGLIAIVEGFRKETKSTKDIVAEMNATVEQIGKQEKIDVLINKFRDLSDETNRTDQQQAELNSTIQELGTIFPEAISKTDEYGKAISLATDELVAHNEALRDNLRITTGAEIEEANQKMDRLLAKRKQLLEQVNSGTETKLEQTGAGPGSSGYIGEVSYVLSPREIEEKRQEINQLTTEINQLGETIVEGNKKLASLDEVSVSQVLEPYKKLFDEAASYSRAQAEKVKEDLTALLGAGLGDGANEKIKSQIAELDKRLGLPTVNRQIADVSKAIADAQAKLVELRAAGSDSTVKQIDDQEKVVQNLVKQWESLTGKKYDNSKALKQELELEKTRMKLLTEQTREEVDIRFQAQQARVDAMKDGADKELAQMKLTHARQNEELKRQKEDLIQANIKLAEAIFSKDPANKGKQFDASGIGLNNNQQAIFDDLELSLRSRQNTEEADFYKKRLQAYQNFAEARKALIEKYNADRSLALEGAATTEVFQEIDRQEKEALDGLASEFAVRSQDYETWIDSVVNMSLKMLEAELSKAQKALFESTKLGQTETEDTAVMRAKIIELESRIKALVNGEKNDNADPKRTISEWRDLQTAIADVGVELQTLSGGMDGLAGSAISSASEIATFALSAISSIETITTTTVSAIEKASIILAIISAALQLFQKLSEALPTAFDKYLKYDAKIEQINKLTDAVNQYRIAVQEARTEENSWFATDSLQSLVDYKDLQSEVLNAYFDKLYEQQAKYQNQQGGGWATAPYKWTAQLYDSIYGSNISGSNYDENTVAAIENLLIETRSKSNGFLGSGWGAKDQRTENLTDWVKKNLGLDLFDSQGLVDTNVANSILENYGDKLVGQTEETLQELVDLREKYDEYLAELRDYVSSLYEPLVDNMVDSLWDWLDNGTDALDSFKEYASDTFRDIVTDMMRTIVLENVVGSFKDDIASLYENYSAGTIDLNKLIAGVQGETSDLIDSYAAQLPALQEMMDAINAGFSDIGVDLSNNAATSSGLSGQITRSITEDTASLLVGLWNRTALDTRGILESTQLSVNHLAAIRDNTSRTVEKLEDAVAELKAINENTLTSASRI